jgi:D-alanyl-D-alanine carboxypeptidase
MSGLLKGGSLRNRISLVLPALLLLEAGQVWGMELNFSENSLSELATRIRNVEVVLPSQHKSIRQDSERKKTNKEREVVTNRQLDSLPPLISPFTIVKKNQNYPAIPKTMQPLPIRHQKEVQSANISPLTTGWPIAQAVTKEAGFSLEPRGVKASFKPSVRAKAMLCVDFSSDKVRLAVNTSEPLPIASITKLLTAMAVIDEMDLESVLEVPKDIKSVERHVVGIRPGDLLTVTDLLHGLLIESGNDCAEVLAGAYPKGGRDGLISAMNRRASEIGATRTSLHTPSGLDSKPTQGRKSAGTESGPRIPNTASAEDVALIARRAFTYPLICKITSMKMYTMRARNEKPRDYRLVSNDKLLFRGLPIAGAKTGYTDSAGKCIVALFRDREKEHMVVVLNTRKHFNAAERIYRWACRPPIESTFR